MSAFIACHVPTFQLMREAIPADAHGRFLLYCRALSVEARSALAMTLEEWRATRD